MHNDLLHGNAPSDVDRINRVFDWGCSIHGDHLYDLALFDFWSSWYPQLHIDDLDAAVAIRWQGERAPAQRSERLAAAYLRIEWSTSPTTRSSATGSTTGTSRIACVDSSTASDPGLEKHLRDAGSPGCFAWLG